MKLASAGFDAHCVTPQSIVYISVYTSQCRETNPTSLTIENVTQIRSGAELLRTRDPSSIPCTSAPCTAEQVLSVPLRELLAPRRALHASCT